MSVLKKLVVTVCRYLSSNFLCWQWSWWLFGPVYWLHNWLLFSVSSFK